MEPECTGSCEGCGTIHIQVLGCHDAASLELRANVTRALALFPVESKVTEVCEPSAVAAAGVTALPALVLEGQPVMQGRVASVAEVVDLIHNRQLLQSKLHRLRTITVAVDISAGSDSALRYAWHIAQKAGADLEVVYVMDRIFNGQAPLNSNFLSGYQRTMQLELDAFIRKSLAGVGVIYRAPAPGAPHPIPEGNEARVTPRILYGFPDAALVEHARLTDLLVLGTTGQGTLGTKLFGSISIDVSVHARCPVLLVPPQAEFQGLKNILYASNFESLDALRIRQAVSFARRFDGQVHFVHVGKAGEDNAELESKLFDLSYRVSHPDKPFRFTTVIGDGVLEAISDYAFYHQIELLVFVTHERSFWDEILHKSIVRDAVPGAGLPILVLHSDEAA
jgi:nucleotide-binding universal stress UspA family protein